VYETMEKWDEAASTWQKVIELFPERKDIVETFFKLGFAYSQAGKHELAYEVYIRIPDIATNEEQQGRAHYWAGMALKSLGRYDEAIREFLLVPRLKTGGMWGVTSKLEAASCYEATGALDDATKIYKEVLASFGPNSDWGRVATEGLARIEQKRSGEPAGTKAEEPGQKKE
jgi:tetratricopeptide (TPR) repeat protein